MWARQQDRGEESSGGLEQRMECPGLEMTLYISLFDSLASISDMV